MSIPIVDVHHHWCPPEMTAALKQAAAGGPSTQWSISTPWTLPTDISVSSSLGITATIFSVTAPGPTVLSSSSAAASLARSLNDAATSLRASASSGSTDRDGQGDVGPGEESQGHRHGRRRRYGFFASLPSPLDTEACIAEITYAFDVLKADGVVLFTRYDSLSHSHSRSASSSASSPENDKNLHYLGDPAMRPVWAELDRRAAVVFVHPTQCPGHRTVNDTAPAPLFDYPHETGRAAMDLLMSGRMGEMGRCKVILAHVGGTMPWLVHRMGMVVDMPFWKGAGRGKAELIADAKKFYFDLALSGSPVVLPAILSFAEPDHILFGTDYPNAPLPTVREMAAFINGFDFGEGEKGEEIRQSIYSGAARKLFPRLFAGDGDEGEGRRESS